MYPSTDYIFDLAENIKDVLSIHITDVSIPDDWYVFDDAYCTTMFMLDNVVYRISPGNYDNDPNKLISELNKLDNESYDYGDRVIDISATGLLFSYNSNNKKVSITNTLDISRNLSWYFKLPNCGENAGVSKINYNLGILLGFTATTYTIDASGSISNTLDNITGNNVRKRNDRIIGESVINTIGPTHFFVSIDDYNNNKPTQSIKSSKTYTENYKLPKYFNSQTMEISFNSIDIEALDSSSYNNALYEISGSCIKKPNNPDNPKNLTKHQKYTILRLWEKMKRSKSNSDSNTFINTINIPDVIATIPVNNPVNNIINWNYNMDSNKKREYFGPVRISKLNIRLYNDMGFLVNLNGKEWTFKLIVKRLYQR